MADEVSAMNNVQPPGHGRANIINALLLNKISNRGGGYRGGGGGGKSKRDWQNESKFMEHQYRLKDEYERAQEARKTEGSNFRQQNLQANNLNFFSAGAGKGGASYEGGIAPELGDTSVHGGRTLVNKDVLPKTGEIRDENGNMTSWRGLNEGGPAEPGGDKPTRPGKPAENDEPEEDGPSPLDGPMHGPAHPFEDERVKKVQGIAGQEGRVRVLNTPMPANQKREAMSGYGDYVAAKQQEAKEAGVPWDDSVEAESKSQYISSMNPFEGRQVDAMSRGQLRAHQDWVRGNPADAKVVAPKIGDADENGSPVVGAQNSRTQPSGTSGDQGSGNQFTNVK